MKPNGIAIASVMKTIPTHGELKRESFANCGRTCLLLAMPQSMLGIDAITVLTQLAVAVMAMAAAIAVPPFPKSVVMSRICGVADAEIASLPRTLKAP